MAQLRDAHTSEILFEGTPYEAVVVADSVGRDQVLFDGVGLGFDPDAVRAEYDKQLAHYEERSESSEPDVTDDDRQAARDSRDELAAASDPSKVDEAQERLEQARERSEAANRGL